MKNPKQKIGRAELPILQYIVENHPVTVREVADHLADTTGQARTTVLTLMERLRQKKLLTRRKSKGVNRYSPRVTKSEIMNTLVNDFVDGMLGGSVSPFLAYLTDNAELDENEIDELRRLVDQFPPNESEEK